MIPHREHPTLIIYPSLHPPLHFWSKTDLNLCVGGAPVQGQSARDFFTTPPRAAQRRRRA